MVDRKEKTRKKLLKLLTRGQLEQMSTRPAPWHADRATLETEVLGHWALHCDDIADDIDKLVRAAR